MPSYFLKLKKMIQSLHGTGQGSVRYYATKKEVEAPSFKELVFNTVFQVEILPWMGQQGDSKLVKTNKEKQISSWS
jgi:hypothetical protein